MEEKEPWPRKPIALLGHKWLVYLPLPTTTKTDFLLVLEASAPKSHNPSKSDGLPFSTADGHPTLPCLPTIGSRELQEDLLVYKLRWISGFEWDKAYRGKATSADAEKKAKKVAVDLWCQLQLDLQQELRAKFVPRT